MKTTVKILIAAAVTSVAATFSTGASAQSLFELHEQHKAQLFNFLFGHHGPNVAINVGPGYQPGYQPTYQPVYQPAPVYQAPPVYVQPYGGYSEYRGPRGYEYQRHERYNGYDGRGRGHDRRDSQYGR